jgi:hypothetical protein
MLTTWKKLEVKTTYLVDIPRVGEELAADGLELVGAWLRHLCDNMWSFPRQWGRCACRSPRRATVPVTSRSLNENSCRGVLGETCGESVPSLRGPIVLLVEGRKVT